jgi:hypothetical protein
VHFSIFPYMLHAPPILSSLLFHCWHLKTSCWKILRLYRVPLEQVAALMEREPPTPPVLAAASIITCSELPHRQLGCPGSNVLYQQQNNFKCNICFILLLTNSYCHWH